MPSDLGNHVMKSMSMLDQRLLGTGNGFSNSGIGLCSGFIHLAIGHMIARKRSYLLLSLANRRSDAPCGISHQ
jgi:hypothetical protein